MSHVLLVTHWTGGDVFPFIKLGAELLKEGHRVTIFSHCIYEKKAKAEGLEFVALDTPQLYEEMNNDLYMLADPVNYRDECIYFHNKYHGKERLVEECKLIEAHCTDKDTIILARHRSSVSGMLAAERLKLPYASVILAPNYFSHMDLHEEIFGNEVKEEINKARAVLNLPAISSWKQWLYSPEYILGVWPEWFAQKDEAWPEGVYPIGYIKSENKQVKEGYGKAVDHLLEEAKSQSKPIVLISGGSSKMVSPLFYETAARACNIAGYFGILVTPYEELVPNPLPDHIIWAKYVPLATLMKEVDVIIHHGGMGTLSEAVDAAIPQIIMPHLTDGPDNAQRLTNIGIARKFAKGRWNAWKIADAIKEVLQDEVKEKCIYYANLNKQVYEAKKWADIIPKIKPYHYVAQVCNKADSKADNLELRDTKNNKVMNKPSREQLLAVLKRRAQK